MIYEEKELLKVIEDRFEETRFKYLVESIFNDVDWKIEGRYETNVKEFEGFYESCNIIGLYEDINEEQLLIITTKLSEEKSTVSSRSIQRNLISTLLKNYGIDHALVAFYSNEEFWRLSYVGLNYSYENGKLITEKIPAKRFSYLLGPNEPNHTVQKQLLVLSNNPNNTVSNLIDAFSVEKVTKEFYKLYEMKYKELRDNLILNEQFQSESIRLKKDITKFAKQFTKKLLGQIVFLYFLQKKGYMGIEVLPVKRMNHSVTDAELDEILNKIYPLEKNYSFDYLAANKLNSIQLKKVLDHCDNFNGNLTNHWGKGDKSFLRTLFQRAKDENINFFENLLEPLFYESLNCKRYLDYHPLFNCKIPFLNGGLFEPLEKYDWRNKDFGIDNNYFSNNNKSGLLDIFDRFNFTVIESEPLESDVAVDPEMLGKIFENLIDSNERKELGAFYTKREVVHYMCKEALIDYLSLKFQYSRNELSDLIYNSDSLNLNHILQIKPTYNLDLNRVEHELKNIKIVDPAVGSGAFPVAILNEIVKLRFNIQNYLCNGSLNSSEVYNLKKETIENCLYGVDYDPSAIDIAKLRLWLSVMIEQDCIEMPPEPLPNLDYKIICRDSLVDEYGDLQLFNNSAILKSDLRKSRIDRSITQLNLFENTFEGILEQLNFLQKKFFHINDESEKYELKDKIESLKKDLIIAYLEENGKKEKLKIFLELQNKKVTPYMVWEIEFFEVFSEKGGFDIVIGNPPYEEVSKYTNNGYYTKRYKEVLDGHYDLYIFFYKKGSEILNESGVLSFITPHTFLNAPQYSKLRRWVYDNHTILELTGRISGLFDTAIVENAIMSFSKQSLSNYETRFKDKVYENGELKDIKIIAENKTSYSPQTFDITIMENQKNSIYDISNTVKLGQIIKRSQGITVYAKAQGEKVNRFNKTPVSQFSKPVTKGKDIFKYEFKYEENYIEYGDWLWRKRKLEFFNGPRIFIRQTAEYPIGIYLEEEMYCIDSVHSFIIKDFEFNIKYILAILNSDVGKDIYKSMNEETKKPYPQIKLTFIDRMPIKIISLDDQEVFAEYVDKIMGSNGETKEQLISELNKKVIELYT